MFHFDAERIKIFADRVLITSKFDFLPLSKRLWHVSESITWQYFWMEKKIFLNTKFVPNNCVKWLFTRSAFTIQKKSHQNNRHSECKGLKFSITKISRAYLGNLMKRRSIDNNVNVAIVWNLTDSKDHIHPTDRPRWSN